MKRLTITFTLILVVTLLGGCITWPYQVTKDVDLIEHSYEATQTLLQQTKKPLPHNSLVVISPFISVDEFGQTTPFGRIISYQIASAFNNAGYRIKTIELPTKLFIKKEDGIIHLSDKTKSALTINDAAGLVVGVYAAGRNTTYVSIQMIDVASEMIISTTDFSVSMGPDAKALLRPSPESSD